MADQPNATTEPTQPVGGKQTEPVVAQPTPEAKFTQADLDRIIADRLGRVESKYADYADLKKKVEDADAANKSELEKAIDKANKAEQRQKELETQTRERVITAEARAIAAELGFTKPEKAIKLADLANAKYEDDGTVTGVREALDALAKEMPELVKGNKGVVSTGATNPAKGAGGATETNAERLQRIRGGGTFNDWTSGGTLEWNPGTNPKQT